MVTSYDNRVYINKEVNTVFFIIKYVVNFCMCRFLNYQYGII